MKNKVRSSKIAFLCTTNDGCLNYQEKSDRESGGWIKSEEFKALNDACIYGGADKRALPHFTKAVRLQAVRETVEKIDLFLRTHDDYVYHYELTKEDWSKLKAKLLEEK